MTKKSAGTTKGKRLVGGTAMPERPLLSEVIEVIRDDLFDAAINRDENFKPLFKITHAEVTVHVNFARELEVGGKLKVYVAELGSSGKETGAVSHSVTLKLETLSGTLDDEGVIITELPKNDPRICGKA